MARIDSKFTQFILPCILLVHVALFLAFWLTNSLFYSSTNDYLTKMLGASQDYISICMLVSALIGIWSAARIILYRLKRSHRLAILTAWLYIVTALIYIAFFYGSFWLLLKESPVQVPRIAQMLLYYRIILDPIILLCAASAVGLWLRGRLIRQKKAGKKFDFLPVGLLLAALAALWALPLAFPPDSVYRGSLPAKPLLIAHRGASMLAPENTLASAALAADLGVYGLETDIHVSRDGALFLMHDDTLLRTTDVKALFPARAKDRAEYFSMAEVSQLNAGQWFVDQDPFAAVANGKVDAGLIEEYSRQAVPTLEQVLQIVRADKLVFIFDLKQPPADQAYTESFFDLCLRQIQAAGIDSQVWFLADQNQLPILRSAAPAMKPAVGLDFQAPLPAADLKTAGYQVVNAEYGLSTDWIRQYQGANLWVNLWTIDEPWQYSRLWLLGVNSTTASNVQEMAAMSQPILSLPYAQYLLIWSAFGILSLVIILGMCTIHIV